MKIEIKTVTLNNLTLHEKIIMAQDLVRAALEVNEQGKWEIHWIFDVEQWRVMIDDTDTPCERYFDWVLFPTLNPQRFRDSYKICLNSIRRRLEVAK